MFYEVWNAMQIAEKSTDQERILITVIQIRSEQF